jgi:hypothetical protein
MIRDIKNMPAAKTEITKVALSESAQLHISKIINLYQEAIHRFMLTFSKNLYTKFKIETDMDKLNKGRFTLEKIIEEQFDNDINIFQRFIEPLFNFFTDLEASSYFQELMEKLYFYESFTNVKLNHFKIDAWTSPLHELHTLVVETIKFNSAEEKKREAEEYKRENAQRIKEMEDQIKELKNAKAFNLLEWISSIYDMIIGMANLT